MWVNRITRLYFAWQSPVQLVSSMCICGIYGSAMPDVQSAQAKKVLNGRLDGILKPKTSTDHACGLQHALPGAHILQSRCTLRLTHTHPPPLIGHLNSMQQPCPAPLVSCLTCAAFHSSEPNTFSETLLSAWYPPGCSCIPTHSFIHSSECLTSPRVQ